MNNKRLLGVLLASTLSVSSLANEAYDERFQQALEHHNADQMVDAMMIFQDLAEQGHIPAQIELAYLHRKAGFYDLAWQWNLEAYNQQSDEAALRLAEMLLNGEQPEGVELTDPLALLESAAANGYVDAYRMLHFLFRTEGQDPYQDDAQSLRWLQTAADAGDSWSVFHLGQVYEQGLYGQSSEWKAALAQYQIAAQQGYYAAVKYLADLYEYGNDLVAADSLLAQQYRTQLNALAEAGNEDL